MEEALREFALCHDKFTMIGADVAAISTTTPASFRAALGRP